MRRVRPGEMLAGTAALALLALTFTDWYGARGRSGGLSAWSAFSVVDVFLALAIVAGLALLAVQVAGRGPAVPMAVEVLTTAVALAAFLLVAYRILDQPGPDDEIEVRAGAWLGLLACAALFAGAWWSMADDRPRPADPPAPTAERRPAPSRS
jgi:hypothetical protein